MSHHNSYRLGVLRPYKHSDGLEPEAAKSLTSTWCDTGGSPFLRLQYHARYDYRAGKLDEWYSLWQLSYTLFRNREKWTPLQTLAYDGMGGSPWPVIGDYEWASRVAKDNNIELPPPTHRLSAWRTKTNKRTGAHTKSAPHPTPREDV